MRVWLGVVLLLTMVACKGREREMAAVAQGDPKKGEQGIVKYGCHGCHDIPKVAGGRGAAIGPPLGGLADRSYIAGRVPNHPDTLANFIQDPHSVDPESAMPKLGVQPQEARDITAFLYSLQ